MSLRVELREPAFELDACLFCSERLGWFVGRKEEFEFDGRKRPGENKRQREGNTSCKVAKSQWEAAGGFRRLRLAGGIGTALFGSNSTVDTYRSIFGGETVVCRQYEYFVRQLRTVGEDLPGDLVRPRFREIAAVIHHHHHLHHYHHSSRKDSGRMGGGRMLPAVLASAPRAVCDYETPPVKEKRPTTKGLES